MDVSIALGRRVVILRGEPGSGKTTEARRLERRARVFYDRVAIHSTNDYFEQERRFDSQRLGEFHERNFNAFVRSLRSGIELVIVDNCNSQRWEYERYVEAARAHGYKVAFLVMPPLPVAELVRRTQKNGHCVPEHTIRNIIARWET
jgi:tRNA uridine 5-carbamoylmethylation protein Kti12